MLVDDILVQLVNCIPLTSNYKIDGYLSVFSTVGRLDGICIIRRSMGRLVEWPLDGRFIVDG